MEKVAGYLNGDGGFVSRCLSPGPGPSEKEKIDKRAHGWRKWQDV